MLGLQQVADMFHEFLAASYTSYGSLSDPSGSSVIVAAVGWIQGTLLGTVATTVAVIAVAWIGVLMLAGRTNFRHGLTVLAGCFVLFGASSIAAGIQASAEGGGVRAAPYIPPPPPAPLPPPVVRRNADPYAGAAVPSR
jgi:type IV secretory pathway VirB2 component (pilin)